MPPRVSNCRFTPTGNAVRELKRCYLSEFVLKQVFRYAEIRRFQREIREYKVYSGKEKAMKNENDSIRTGIYISRNLLKLCDENMPKTNVSSRSEFISNAIEMYIAWLNSKENSKILTPALESVIGAKIAGTENRIARLLFKLSVETAIMMNIVAASNDIDRESLDRLRISCVKEVKRLNGNFTFEDALDWQKE